MMWTASAATSAGSTHAADRQRGAELLAARLEPVAEQRRGQRRVDEAGGDEVDPDRRELEREVGGQRGQRGGAVAEISARPGAARRPPVPLMKSSVPGRSHPAAPRAWRPAIGSSRWVVDVAASRVEVDLRPAARSTDRRPVTSTWSIGVGSSSKNRAEPSEVGGVEGRVPGASTSVAASLEALGIAAGEDDVGALGPGRVGRSRARCRRCRRSRRPSARAAPAPASSRSAPVASVMRSLTWGDQLRPAAISARSAFSASA